MLEFTVNNWKLEPHPAMLLIPELKAVFDAEKKSAEGRSAGLKNLLYVWGMVAKGSPFDDLAPETRDQNVRRCVYGDAHAGPMPGSKEWLLMEDARVAYLFYNDTSEDRLMHELSHAVDMITDFLRTSRIEGIKDGKQMGTIIGSIKSVRDLLINKREAEKVLKDGLEKSKTKHKANAEPSPLERGLLNQVLNKSRREAAERLAAEEADEA